MKKVWKVAKWVLIVPVIYEALDVFLCGVLCKIAAFKKIGRGEITEYNGTDNEQLNALVSGAKTVLYSTPAEAFNEPIL